MFPPENDDDKYILLPFFWIPGENIPKRVKNHHVPYDTWAKGGHLNATDGYIIQYDFIEQKIIDLRSEYDIEAVTYDEWGAHQMIQRLERLDGIEYVAMRQGYKSLSPPSKEMMRLVLDEKIQHGGHPVLRWMFNNVFIETDAAGNIKPSKEKASEKIDGAIFV
jgi:phage terminase large subunit-like protein